MTLAATWWRRMDSLFCGKATGRRTCHWHGRWDGPFESTLESKMSNPCGVTQTGSPQSRLALWGKEPQQNERTVTLKKSPQAIWRLRRRGGGGWIRTIEGKASRFTVCPLWPLGYSSVFSWAEEGWSWWTDSNPRPADYKSAALPAELHQHRSLPRSQRSLL